MTRSLVCIKIYFIIKYLNKFLKCSNKSKYAFSNLELYDLYIYTTQHTKFLARSIYCGASWLEMTLLTNEYIEHSAKTLVLHMAKNGQKNT